ncbi:MAG: cation:dicarboxylase symporter family transporter, partial [Vicinamibacterales bacterium]|nr:cation:dicarboxylase symporter family transporter [Vicinamibacterales bacterium]
MRSVVMTDPIAPDSAAPTSASGARFPLYLQIIVAMLAGAVAGPLLGPASGGFGELGRLVIQLIKAAATPLLFFAIVHAILRTEVRGRAAVRLLGWALLNASIALGIGLLLSNLIRPGQFLAGIGNAAGGSAAAYADRKLDVLATLRTFVPSSVVGPFAENLVLSVILLAVLAGVGLRRAR